MVRIGARPLGDGEPVLVIAEAGVNHGGDPQVAHQLVDVAADAGADCVKFQTFAADRVASASAEKATYQRERTAADETQREMLRRLELPAGVIAELAAHARERDVIFMSSPFDPESADALEPHVPAFKVGSGELTNLPFLRHLASHGKPVLLSTGMATLEEVARAAESVTQAGADIVLLHCVSSYPADPVEANLRAMETMRIFGAPVGWSDHTIGDETAIAAVALGATVIEKHLTLDRTAEGPDHAASIEPPQFSALVDKIRLVEAALGDGVKRPAPSEEDTRRVARRSLAARRDLKAGTVLDADMLTALRPATGISPADLERVVGRRLRRDVRAGHLLLEDVVE